MGDGATDAQAKPPAKAFVGYGGVTVRDAVRDKACWCVKAFEPMIQVLQRFGKNKLGVQVLVACPHECYIHTILFLVMQ